MTPTLVCGAMPFGYGPAAKLLVIATALRGRGIRLVFTGRGTALELVSRTRRLFDEIVPAEPVDRARDQRVRSAAGVLSLMDRELAQSALDATVPLYVVDSLLWMRDAIPPAFHGATRYWAQDFLGLRERVADDSPTPVVVGPVVDPKVRSRERGDERLLINLGGCESPDGPDPNAPRYAAFVVAGFRDSTLSRRFARRTTLMAGARCADALRTMNQADDVELISVSHAGALERLARASLILTAPGLTMTLESFQSGAPTYFLPPQNYSQWCALRRLRTAGLAPHALHWEDLSGCVRLRDRMPESERTPLVRAAIARFTIDGEARRQLCQRMDEVGRADDLAVVEAQTRFFRSLGPNGALAIAEEIAADILSTTVGRGIGLAAATSRGGETAN
jgi:hypothetical protein